MQSRKEDGWCHLYSLFRANSGITHLGLLYPSQDFSGGAAVAQYQCILEPNHGTFLLIMQLIAALDPSKKLMVVFLYLQNMYDIRCPFAVCTVN